jgi:hypothetical protein
MVVPERMLIMHTYLSVYDSKTLTMPEALRKLFRLKMVQ